MVNVNDYEVPTDLMHPPCRLSVIFNQQRILMEKYHKIELKNGLMHPSCDSVPYDLSDRFAQHRLKDFAWRFTEEVMEACDANNHYEHFHEELVDALHFFAELLISAGITVDDIRMASLREYPRADTGDLLDFMDGPVPQFSYDDIKLKLFSSLQNLGMGMNCLKNKPWKQSHILTDKTEFKRWVTDSFVDFLMACHAGGMTGQKMYETYLKKHQVNQFRQRSKY